MEVRAVRANSSRQPGRGRGAATGTGEHTGGLKGHRKRMQKETREGRTCQRQKHLKTGISQEEKRILPMYSKHPKCGLLLLWINDLIGYKLVQNKKVIYKIAYASYHRLQQKHLGRWLCPCQDTCPGGSAPSCEELPTAGAMKVAAQNQEWCLS